MTPEILFGLAAVFVSGGAIGSAGTLLAQWIFRKVDAQPARGPALGPPDAELLRDEVAELGRHVRNLDARLDFTERLLDGALPLTPPPDPLDPPPRHSSGTGEEDS